MNLRKHNSGFTRIALLAVMALVGTGTMMLGTPAMAHDADCPFCKLKLLQNTKEQDNEVVLKYGNKKIEYRCVFCAIADSKRYKGDLVVLAPSEKKGEPIVLKRTAANWSAPEGTVFLNAFKKHADCSLLSRAFTSQAALETYAHKNGVHEFKATTMGDFVKNALKPAG